MKYYPLSDDSRERFLTDARVLELQKYGAPVIQEAISKHFKLDDILGEAQAIAALWDRSPAKRWSNFPMIRNPNTGRGN
jgi:hypothetical protein